MGTFGIWHWIVVIVLAVLLFGGRGKISGLMGDLAQGIRNFKEGLKEPDRVTDKHETAEAKKADEVKHG